MLIQRITQAVIGLTLLVPSCLLALSLGDITVDSSLYQPLQATIPLTDSQNVDLSTVRASLGSDAQFKQAGITRSDAMKQLQFTVKADPQGKAWVSVTSKQAIVNSSLQFIVRLSWPYGETMRWYTLKLAPSSTSSPDTVAKMKASALEDVAATTAATQQKKSAIATAQAQVSALMTQQLEQINTHLQTLQVSLSSLEQTNAMLKSQLDSQNQAVQQLQQQVTTIQTQQAAAPAPAVAPSAAAPAKPATSTAVAPEDQSYHLKTWQAFLAAFVILFIILRMVAVLRRQSAQAAAAPAPDMQPAAPGIPSAAQPVAPIPSAPVTQAPATPAGIKPTVVTQAGQPNAPAAPAKPRVVPITELRKAQENGAAQATAPAQNNGPRPQLAAAAKAVPTPATTPAAKPALNSSAPLIKPIEEKGVVPAEKSVIVTPTPGDSEYSSATVENRHATQLDLAQAYISMGDHAAAKKLLKEVIAKADSKHRKEAQQLLDKIPAKKGK